MNFSVGVFDLIGAAVPGSFYLMALGYVAARTDWPGIDQVNDLDGSLLVLMAALLAYLLGMTFGPIAQWVERLVPGTRPSENRAKQEFRERNPSLAECAFLVVDHYTLLAGLRQHAQDAAGNVDRNRATSNMLRSASLALLVGVCIAVVEVAAGPESVLATIAATLMSIGMLAALVESRRLEYWAITATIEAAVWLPDISQARLPAVPATQDG